MAHRLFTREEAESVLPRLADLLLQIQEGKREHDAVQKKVWEFQQKMNANGHLVGAELNQARQDLAKAAAEVNSLIEKVQELDCELKEIEQGLVDFRTLMEGREVYLCWKLGEPEITWWHELETGFAGRQPLSEQR